MHRLALLLLLSLSSLAMAQPVTIQIPIGPPSAPLLLLEQEWPGEVVLVLYRSVDEATTRIVRGEAQLTVLPVNMASILANRGLPVSLLHVSTWGVLYLITTDPAVNGWQDLGSSQVYVGSPGATPDVLTRYLLGRQGLSAKDLAYLGSPEIAQLMIQGLAKTAVLPEPMVTQVASRRADLRIVGDFFEDWFRLEGIGLPQAGMVVDRTFAQKNPQWLQEFEARAQESTQRVMADPQIIAARVQEVMGIPAPVFTQSVSRIRMDVVSAKESREAVTAYLTRLMEFSPEMVGGALPNEGFYWVE